MKKIVVFVIGILICAFHSLSFAAAEVIINSELNPLATKIQLGDSVDSLLENPSYALVEKIKAEEMKVRFFESRDLKIYTDWEGRIFGIVLRSDQYETERGLMVGMKVRDMINLYGLDYFHRILPKQRGIDSAKGRYSYFFDTMGKLKDASHPIINERDLPASQLIITSAVVNDEVIEIWLIEGNRSLPF